MSMNVVLPIPRQGLDVDALKRYPVEIQCEHNDCVLVALPPQWYARWEDPQQTWLAVRDEQHRVILSFQPTQKRTFVGGRGG